MNKTKFLTLSSGLVLAILTLTNCGELSEGEGYNACTDLEPVTIGTQVWAKKNLDCNVEGSKCYGEGGKVAIGHDENNNRITKTLSPAEVQANCAKYGRLYDWSTAMGFSSNCNSSICSGQIQPKHRGICPTGWHLPSNEEMKTLIDFAGGFETAGAKLKAKSGWNDYQGKSAGNGTDNYSFTALPGGVGSYDGNFYIVGSNGFWWHASEYESSGDSAYGRLMAYRNDSASWFYDVKSYLLSVRCLQD
jgi:uncharacterized protein (TIGR02145 family)